MLRIGDLHGDLNSATTVLQMAKVIDSSLNWIGGRTYLVQTGDIVDRGPDTIALYKLFIKLSKQALDQGGRVFSLLGFNFHSLSVII